MRRLKSKTTIFFLHWFTETGTKKQSNEALDATFPEIFEAFIRFLAELKMFNL